MTLAEKIGQLTLVHVEPGELPGDLRAAVRAGKAGAVLDVVDVATVNELQRIAAHDSRLGIPLLVGRDVIHGFKTVLPIPLGQAAAWNPDLVQQGARMAALEAAASGVNWTFAPMIDIARDPRWGRIAESFGEDSHLAAVLGAAAIRGFQGDGLSRPGAIAACAKHFVGYGASEGGRDYGYVGIPEVDLRNVHMPPFRAAADAGVATFMAAFSDVNGVPASANPFLLRTVLRGEWKFPGFVVSDWDSIVDMVVHGLVANDEEAALAALSAGVDMEMVSTTYRDHLPGLLAAKRIDPRLLDNAVRNVLRVKLQLGLFERTATDPAAYPGVASAANLALARELATQSLVLLQNRNGVLPLAPQRLHSLAVIGPLADDAYEQLGTWAPDGDPALSRTPLQAIRETVGARVTVRHVRAMATTRTVTTAGFTEAVAAASGADASVLFLGEESILSGESHSRASIDLPGNQLDLVRAVKRAGKPVIVVILAGRPLTIEPILAHADAVLYAWHPGVMAGPAIADILFGVESPSGKLPVTFPRVVGQVPLYYAHRSTGKPASQASFLHIDDIAARTPQAGLKNASQYLDAGYAPLYEFGYGLSYTSFTYADIAVAPTRARVGVPISVRAVVRNVGQVAGDEVAQLYVRDLVGSVTRPVRELKGFQRIHLEPGESREVAFQLSADDLAFYGRDLTRAVEPGSFHVWIGGSSSADLRADFELTAD
ncbi:MAG: glycoside hydrolase family 3 C-terminal domain-containing protein [Proteobacteria bacterium]|nr:glycoside hydrolase family 3 C-terminal domain-containing protein [Pseudomonadota bacterium]